MLDESGGNIMSQLYEFECTPVTCPTNNRTWSTKKHQKKISLNPYGGFQKQG